MLRTLVGDADFLYMADSKLCVRDNADHNHRAGGPFVIMMPRTRLDDAELRNRLKPNTPP